MIRGPPYHLRYEVIRAKSESFKSSVVGSHDGGRGLPCKCRGRGLKVARTAVAYEVVKTVTAATVLDVPAAVSTELELAFATCTECYGSCPYLLGGIGCHDYIIAVSPA